MNNEEFFRNLDRSNDQESPFRGMPWESMLTDPSVPVTYPEMTVQGVRHPAVTRFQVPAPDHLLYEPSFLEIQSKRAGLSDDTYLPEFSQTIGELKGRRRDMLVPVDDDLLMALTRAYHRKRLKEEWTEQMRKWEEAVGPAMTRLRGELAKLPEEEKQRRIDEVIQYMESEAADRFNFGLYRWQPPP